MSRPRSAPIVPVRDPSAGTTLSDLIITWAIDADTGRPIYLFELGEGRTGSRCRCVCVSCNLPLQGVNVGKTEWKKRPHFRHHEGAQRDDCAILSARAAVLRQLETEGWISLPRYRRSAKLTGLSGQEYTGWAEADAEQVRIRHVSFRDRVAAILTLGDGRKLRVSLTGVVGGAVDDNGFAIPTIYLGIDDPAIAAMGPEDLRSRLSLVPTAICWHSHWRDGELHFEAERAAAQEATLNLDAVPPGLDLPWDLDPALRRQTVLHYEVLRVLAESKSLKAPGLLVERKAKGSAGELLTARRQWGEATLSLTNVALERRAGRVVPDVTCVARELDGSTFDPLFIEVTVTNVIDDERRARIRNEVAGGAALEIDLGTIGGKLTRDLLRQVVLEQVDCKRWLWRPELVTAVRDVEAELSGLVAASQALADEAQARAVETSRAREAQRREASDRAWQLGERRLSAQSMSKAELRAAYLRAFIEWQEVREAPGASADAAANASRRFSEAAGMLQDVGHPEAVNPRFTAERGVLARLCSILLGKSVGLGGLAWLDAVMDETRDAALHRKFFSLYAAAIRQYKPLMADDQQERFASWRTMLLSKIQSGDSDYLRPSALDELLELLFPELKSALDSDWLRCTPKLNIDAIPADWNPLRGKALERWVQQHPERAEELGIIAPRRPAKPPPARG